MSARTITTYGDDLHVYTGAEIMDRLRCSRRTMTRLIAEGHLRTTRTPAAGQRVYVTAASLRAFLNGTSEAA